MDTDQTGSVVIFFVCVWEGSSLTTPRSDCSPGKVVNVEVFLFFFLSVRGCPAWEMPVLVIGLNSWGKIQLVVFVSTVLIC